MKYASNQSSRPAISYLRYSTKTQAQGGSEDRQVDWAVEYCKTNNLKLVDTYKDLGVSGFKGKHSKKGKLAALLEDCKSGKIPKGYILIIENFDRLSREEVPVALQRFLALINDYQLEIHTLDDNRIYAPGKIDLTELIITIVIMGRAHGESARKSVLISKAWQQKREAAKAFSRPGKQPMGRHPNWLDWNDKKQEWIVNLEAKSTIQYIFKLCIKSELGRYQIAQRLNSEKVPLFTRRAKSWSSSIVKRIMTNHSLLGKMVPSKSKDETAVIIENFYPTIIDQKTFDDAQQAMISRSSHTGRPSKSIHNYSILTGIGYYLDSKIHKGHYKNKNSDIVTSTYTCISNNRNYYLGFAEHIDHFVTSLISELDDKELSSNSNNSRHQKKLQTDLDKSNKQLKMSKHKLHKLIQAVSLAPDIPQLVKQMQVEEKNSRILQEAVTDLQKQLANIKTESGIHDRETVAKIKEQALVKKDLQSRQELQITLKQLIQRLDLYKEMDHLPEDNEFKNMAVILQSDTKIKFWARIKLFNDAVILGAMTVEGKIARIRWEDPT